MYNKSIVKAFGLMQEIQKYSKVALIELDNIQLSCELDKLFDTYVNRVSVCDNDSEIEIVYQKYQHEFLVLIGVLYE